MNYLYQITNLINGKIYIGVHQTNNIDDSYMGSGTAILRAIKKYGIENFKKDILGFFDTYEAALLAEKTTVDNDFLLRKDVYNLRTGGVGGWEHINNLPKEDRINVIEYKRKVASGEIKVGGTGNWTSDSRLRIASGSVKGLSIAKVTAHTSTAKEKRKSTQSRIKFQQGENNSQYGRLWISNIETKQVMRLEKDTKIPEGWVKGKTGRLITTCWVNNYVEERIIQLTEEEYYIQKGYIRGRLRNSMPQRL
jgi:hypothetical protein